jgi:hypothetical protein
VSEDPFGFKAGQVAHRLASIKPGLDEPSPISIEALDRVGQRQGFVDRDPVVVIRKTHGGRKRTEQVNYRCAPEQKNRLIKFCEANGDLSYADAIDHMLDLIEKHRLK